MYRKSESGEINQKRRRLNRYVGDFCRDDFTSDFNWKLFRKYYEKTSQKLKVFQQRDRRKSKRIKALKDIMVHLKKKNGLISSEVATVMEVSKSF